MIPCICLRLKFFKVFMHELVASIDIDRMRNPLLSLFLIRKPRAFDMLNCEVQTMVSGVT